MPLLALLTCVTALLAGAADLARARAPSTRIAWSPCGAQLQCGNARVPLDWSRPDGRSLTLPVIRRLASGPGPKLGSLFVNGGGGMGSTKLVRLDGASLDALGQGRFDVVGWALRGGGGSPLVRCFADARSRARFWDHVGLPVTRAQELRYVPKVRAYAQRCAALSRSLLAPLHGG
jgi:pimeloyl-ACP methyl ester carboxylesterase